MRKALFENQVVVIRNQRGIEPKTLPQLTKLFDPTATDIHSAGEKAVSDPRNILSAYKAGRIPRTPQVGIIGSGKFQNYEGIDELEVIHLVRCYHGARNIVHLLICIGSYIVPRGAAIRAGVE